MNGSNPHPLPPPFLSDEEIGILRRTVLAKFPEDEQMMFIRTCQRTKLDPFTKQIYPTKRFQKVKDEHGQTKKVPTLVIVTGIMGLTAVADRTGHYDGCEIKWAAQGGIWHDEWLADVYPEAAKCTVFHRQRKHDEVAIARWNSFVGTQWNQENQRWEVTDFWEKMPDYMLAKCAKAAALRGAFPDQLSNIYIREELESHITDSEAELDAAEAEQTKRLEEASKAAAAVPPKQAVDVEPVAPPPKSSTTAPTPAPTTTTSPARSPETAAAKVTPMPMPEVQTGARAQRQQPSAPQSLGEAVQQKREEILGPGGGQDGEGIDMGPVQESTPWKEHRIKGLRHAKFFGRTIGELSIPELQILDQQWIPAVREKWDSEANEAQKEDVAAMEAAIAYHKMERPW